MITLSTSKPVSPFGRDLKGTFAALQSLLRTKAINFTLRLATIPFMLRRNIIDLIRGALDVIIIVKNRFLEIKWQIKKNSLNKN